MSSIKLITQRLVILFLGCVSIYSCKTEEVYFNVTEPAPVTIPLYVKRVGIINRSLISDSNNSRKKIDEVLSAKSPTVDKECSYECIRGIRDGLIQSNIFQNNVFFDSIILKNSFPGAFPSPLSWDVVDSICRMNNVDALFSLELFHTDTRLNVAASPAGVATYGVAAVAASTTFGTNVNTGWRIYDPQNKIIFDEYSIGQRVTFAGNPLNPFDVAAAIMTHKQAVTGASYNIGQSYVSRILPYTIRVCHEFYIRGTDNFKVARRMADAGDWNNAADLWNKETANSNPRIRARAYYNMAIISEMNGDLDKAIDWAKQAYETGGKRLALYYLNDLQDRKADNDILKSQAH